MSEPHPKNLADALLQLLKARGLSDDQTLAVLGEVITGSPEYSGKWSEKPPEITAAHRQRLAERIESSERLRGALVELGYDPNEMVATVRERTVESDKCGE